MKHLGIIMDGNRRWAKARFMPALFGHKAGFDNLRDIAKLASKKGIGYLTVWALSTENLVKRTPEEVANILKLVDKTITLLPEFMEQNIQVQLIGDIGKLPDKSQKILGQLVSETQSNSGLILTIALVYGGQDEIIRATKKIILAGKIPEEITEQEFKKYLDTAHLPNPDVIVRTGGDLRHSGFLLFDSAYSEYYFTEKKWPEFDEEELDRVIEFFESSQRNFGK